jgi:hypothetical protein
MQHGVGGQQPGFQRLADAFAGEGVGAAGGLAGGPAGRAATSGRRRSEQRSGAPFRSPCKAAAAHQLAGRRVRVAQKASNIWRRLTSCMRKPPSPRSTSWLPVRPAPMLNRPPGAGKIQP